MYVHDISSEIYIQIIIVLLTMYKATYLSSAILIFSYNTTDLDRLVKAAVTTSILSIVVTVVSAGLLIKLIGRGPARIVYFLANQLLFLHIS